MKWRNMRRIVVAGAFLVLATLACGPDSEDSVPSIAISSPASGSVVAVGEEVRIVSTAAADAGVARVELAINGRVVRSDTPPSGNPVNFSIAQIWTPTAEGAVTVSAVVYDTEETRSEQATITLQVMASQGGVPTVAPTEEPTEAPTGAPVTTDEGCTLDSQYVADVTIPDGTVMSFGQPFVKTWQVRNSGTCDWVAGYELVFVSGAQMGGPGALPATPAGGETDVSVSLAAPSAYGTHKGTWRMRANDGTMFGVNLTALIAVPAPVTDTPEPPPPTDTPTSPAVAGDRITNLSPSSVGTAINTLYTTSGCHVGDTGPDLGQQCFITFDVSTVPDSATIREAGLYYPSATEEGDAFGDLGSLHVYLHEYGTLDVDDYTQVADSAKRIHAALGRSDLDSPRALNQRGFETLQDSLAGNRFQIRLQFAQETDEDGEVDDLELSGIRLKVTYRP